MKLTDTHKKIIKKCKKDPKFFIEKFCKVKHQTLGILPFKLFDYQNTSIDSFLKNRFTIYRKCRQSGVSTLAGAFALWFGMFYNNKTILIVSKRDDDAKKFFERNVVFPYNELPAWMREIWILTKENEHEMVLMNGSSIKSLTSAPNTLRSNSASLNIIDEAAFIPNMDEMWAGGQQCCSVDTIISTSSGLLTFSNMLEQNNIVPGDFVEWEGQVYTDEGIKSSEHIWNNGYSKTKKIATHLGYELECTDRHRLRVVNASGYEWKHAEHISTGDQVCLLPNTCADTIHYFEPPIIKPIEAIGDARVCCYGCLYATRITADVMATNLGYLDNKMYLCDNCIEQEDPFIAPDLLSECFAETIGFFNGTGLLGFESNCFSVLCNSVDTDLVEHLCDNFAELGLKPITEDMHNISEISVKSHKLINFLFHHKLELGEPSPKLARVPGPILAGGRKVLAAFLRGLFESSSMIAVKDGVGGISISCESEVQSRQIQTALLSLGIIAKRFFSEQSDEDDRTTTIYTVMLLDGANNQKFINEIGFISDSKKKLVSKITSYDCSLMITGDVAVDFAKAANKALGTDHDEYYKLNKIIVTHKLKYDYALNLFNRLECLRDTKLGHVLARGMIVDRVSDTVCDSAMTADISVPDNNTYIANGFVSHNTMMHGGRCIVISTTCGVGNWYHDTWVGAENNASNGFNPININWWDMNWELKYLDPMSKQEMTISPTKDIRKCETQEEIDRFGPYWSPWLAEQIAQLERKGEAHLFRQEILAEFIGTGNSVIDRKQLLAVEATIMDPAGTFNVTDYAHPLTEERCRLNFARQLHIWKEPINYWTYLMQYAKQAKISTGKARKELESQKITEQSFKPHRYVMGVDTSTGSADDYSTIEVIDVTVMEQVAELQIKTPIKQFAYMADWIGRYYNNAFMVVESTGIGAATIQALNNDIGYPNLYREESIGTITIKKKKKIGFNTNSRAQKGLLEKALIDSIGDSGVTFYSKRLYGELLTYIHLGNGKTGAEPGNRDDLVLATGMACYGIHRAISGDSSGLLPIHNMDPGDLDEIPITREEMDGAARLTELGGPAAMLPIVRPSEAATGRSPIENELGLFTAQLVARNRSPQAVSSPVVRKNRIILDLRPKRQN